MRTTLFLLFVLALCLIAVMAHEDQLLSNREEADVLVDAEDIHTLTQRSLLSDDVFAEQQQYTKEEALVAKIKALKEDLETTTTKKCSAPKPKKIRIIRLRSYVAPQTKHVSQKCKNISGPHATVKPKPAVQKCKSIADVKKMVKKNDSILKTIKRQIKYVKKPVKKSSKNDILSIITEELKEKSKKKVVKNSTKESNKCKKATVVKALEKLTDKVKSKEVVKKSSKNKCKKTTVVKSLEKLTDKVKSKTKEVVKRSTKKSNKCKKTAVVKALENLTHKLKKQAEKTVKQNIKKSNGIEKCHQPLPKVVHSKEPVHVPKVIYVKPQLYPKPNSHTREYYHHPHVRKHHKRHFKKPRKDHDDDIPDVPSVPEALLVKLRTIQEHKPICIE